MRKTRVATAVTLALMADAPIRHGPISPYTSDFNRRLYYSMFGQQLMTPRSVGKSVMLPFRYSPRNINA